MHRLPSARHVALGSSRRAGLRVPIAVSAALLALIGAPDVVRAEGPTVDATPERAIVATGAVSVSVHVANVPAGTEVGFHFLAGSANDPGADGPDLTCLTDAAGWCTVTYAASRVGTDTICATTLPNDTKCDEPLSGDRHAAADVVERVVRAPATPTPPPTRTASPTPRPVLTPPPTPAPPPTATTTPSPPAATPAGEVRSARADKRTASGVGQKPAEPTSAPASRPAPAVTESPLPSAGAAAVSATALPAADQAGGAATAGGGESRLRLWSPEVIFGSVALLAGIAAVGALWAARLVFSED